MSDKIIGALIIALGRIIEVAINKFDTSKSSKDDDKES